METQLFTTGESPLCLLQKKTGAENIAAMSTFSAFPVPNPDKYETWQEWAKDFTEIINGPSH